MKAVIYARYSSDNQREESIEGQLRECMEYAEHNDITVIGNYIDRAYSAKTDHRPEFQHMIKDSYKHCFDMIIVWKLDRFARNRYDSAHYKTLLKKNGVKVVSARENIAEGSEGILLEAVLEGYAEFYSAELSEKVKRGMTENALKCKTNGGVVPYGYVVKEQRLAIEPTEAEIVREIFRMCADGKTAKAICQTLKEQGITKKDGKPIHYNTIIYMLSNRTYMGEYKFGKTIIPDGNPAIIPEELFNKVQEEVKKNSHAPARHKAEDDYLLTTKLFCGKCGAYMVGESGTNRGKGLYRYYKCINVKKHTCDKKTVRKDWLEGLAVKHTLEILNDEKLMDCITDKAYELQGEENPRIPRLKEQLAQTEKKIGNLVAAIEQGIIAASTQERLAQLEKDKSGLEVAILQEQIRRPHLTKEQIRYGIEKFKSADTVSKEGKASLINGFINSVYLYDDRITFIFNLRNCERTVVLADAEVAAECSDLKTNGEPFRW